MFRSLVNPFSLFVELFIEMCNYLSFVGQLSEVVADLAEEHSTAQLAGERLEAEQADRMRLEKELDGAQVGAGNIASKAKF